MKKISKEEYKKLVVMFRALRLQYCSDDIIKKSESIYSDPYEDNPHVADMIINLSIAIKILKDESVIKNLVSFKKN